MLNQNPLISVIITVFNGETYLTSAIESVLSQSYQPLEVIIIDDGSEDSSREIALSFAPRINYHFQPNKGLGTSLNQGIELANGQYFAFLDQDDLWVDGKLVRQMEAFTLNPDLDIVFGNIQQFYSPDMDPVLRQQYKYAQQTMSGYCADTMLVSRQAFYRIGQFDPSLRAAPFLDWYTRAKDLEMRIELIPAVLAKRRIHNSNQSITSKDAVNKEYIRLLKAALDRRRNAE